jgi:hypothetical protein
MDKATKIILDSYRISFEKERERKRERQKPEPIIILEKRPNKCCCILL